MADTKEEKTMPLELTIQRELAYRRKIAALHLHPNDKPIKELLTLQVIQSSQASHPKPGPSSTAIASPCIPGTKRKEPTSSINHQHLQHEPMGNATRDHPLQHEPVPLQYEPRSSTNHQHLQHEPMSNAARDHPLQHEPVPLQYEPRSSTNHQHLQHEPMSNATRDHPLQHEPISTPTHLAVQLEPRSCTHRSPLQNPLDRNLSYKPQTDYLYCKTCQVTCPSPFNLKQHLRGHKHRAKVQEQEFMQKAGTEEKKSNQRHWCELCKVFCMNEDLLQMHFCGQKHRAEVKKLEISKQCGVIPNQRKWCELCNIWCIDEFAFRQHLQGKKHIFQLHTMERGKKKGK